MTKYFEGEHLNNVRMVNDNGMVELIYKRPNNDRDLVRFHMSLLFPFIKEQLKKDNFQIKKQSHGYYRLSPAQIRSRFIDSEYYRQIYREEQQERKEYEKARY
tara:strand:+ start:4688 stop:4996 length:309 start_codon:yes stop_codon:yes gene_type:complete